LLSRPWRAGTDPGLGSDAAGRRRGIRLDGTLDRGVSRSRDRAYRVWLQSFRRRLARRPRSQTARPVSGMSNIGLIVADPGHFHAALVQKEMYPNLSPKVHVYAPVGPDLVGYLTRISRFNTRRELPTAWELEVHACPDFLERMCRERP